MEMLVNLIFSADFFSSILRVTTPILFATMAALISSKAGVTNIGIEGTMLMASLMGVVGSAATESAWIGLLIAVLTGIAFAWLLSFFALQLKTDVVLAGIALNLLASGLTIFILYILTGDKGVSTGLASKTLPALNIPFIQDIPFIGKIISGQNILTYIAILSVFIMYFFLKYTKTGIYIRAVGEYSPAVDTAGQNVNGTKRKALLISGALAGFGGAFMSMGYLSMFTKDMIAGRGFIALAAEAMGMGKPILCMGTSFLFGLADVLSNNLLNIPGELVRMIPYLVTVLALSVYAWRKNKKKVVNTVKDS